VFHLGEISITYFILRVIEKWVYIKEHNKVAYILASKMSQFVQKLLLIHRQSERDNFMK
jgi:hypothetical protein